MKKLNLIYCFIFNLGIVHAQNEIVSIEQEIWNGHFQMANKKIDKLIGRNDNLDAKLLKLKGDISKREGDIEQAFEYWSQSNTSRKRYFPKNNFHIAWNYALLSNYHYEKINKKQSVLYADSCLYLLKGLTIAQQKDIEIHKIWNILGQSYKLSSTNESLEQIQNTQKRAQSFYLKSKEFIQKNKLDDHYLAETYRLIGNSFNDLTVFTIRDNVTRATYYYKQSSEFYDKAAALFQKKYGSKHYELARTYFVHGLLNYYANNKLDINVNQKAIAFLESAIESYGVKLNYGSSANFEFIPNQQDFLMACKYLTLTYFREFESDLSVKWLNKAKNINQIAIIVWENIHHSINGDNTNQNLAIYNLVPFSETITLELFNKRIKKTYSVNSIFKANQKLKYYDLIKNGHIKSIKSTDISIHALQNKLKKNEIFLDFHVSMNTSTICVIRITSQSYKVFELPNLESGLIEQYHNSIKNFDYDGYTNSAHKIFQALVKPCDIGSADLIFCLDGWLNNIPFESLLTSSKNFEKKDYRQLSYLLLHNRIQYVLNPQLFRNGNVKMIPFEMEIFIPQNSVYTVLPFSSQFGKNLQSQYNGKLWKAEDATKHRFMNMSAPIVHLSGHGVISNEDALNCYLVMSDSQLFLKDLSHMKNVPSLMVLNTCNSANGKLYHGEGVNGFVRTLSMLGVQSILSNLWEVDDRASNQLLEQFYANLNDGKSSSESLRLSQIGLIENAPSSELGAPYYWAGHRITGEELTFKNKKSDFMCGLGLYWLLLLPVFIAVVYWRRKIKRKLS